MMYLFDTVMVTPLEKGVTLRDVGFGNEVYSL